MQLKPLATLPIQRILWALTALALSVIYGPVLATMVHVWRTDSYAGHGMFVPIFSTLFLWMGRGRIRAAAGRGDPAGMLVIVLALGILFVGKWVESILIQGLSVVLAIAGLVLLGFGMRCLRQTAFPIAFLLFMVPLPRPVVDALTRHLQNFAAGFAGSVLEILDIPVHQTGVLIFLSTITLEVEEVCNGLRFLMALLVFTVAFAHVSQRTLARKLVLIASAVPVAVLANAARVAMVAVGVHYVGPQAAIGIIHNIIAKVAWALTIIPLVGLALILRRGGTSEKQFRNSKLEIRNNIRVSLLKNFGSRQGD